MELVSETKVNIFHLPEEILFKIMNLADCCSKTNHDIRHVCKQFYKVYCGFTSCGLVFDSNKIRDDVFDSMMHSLRRTSSFDIENHEECSKTSKLKKIVERFAVHVRKFEFSQDHKRIHFADFEYIMRSMINVEEATFKKLNVYGHPKKLATRITLPMLKKLILKDCDAESVDAILLSIKASLLQEFHVHTEDVIDFTQFFMDHKTIKHVTMSGELENPKAFEHLQLEKLQVCNYGNALFLCDVISHQPKLKCLNLLSDPDVSYDYCFDDDEDPKEMVTDDVFTVICKLKELETLKIGIGQVTPKAIGEISSLVNLNELVMMAIRENADFDNVYDYSVHRVRNDVHFQKSFQKLIAISLPRLESFTWSLKDSDLDLDIYMSDDEELMEHTRQREYSSLTKVDIIKTMAPSFPNLKYLKIEMKTSDDTINVRHILKQFPHLETLQLKISSSFEGPPISMHENIKHVKINEIERNLLVDLISLTPILESLEIRKTQFSLEKSFLQNLQAAVPDSLINLKLNFNSQRRHDFAVENIVILQEIIKKLRKCEVKLTGNCNFDTLVDKIDRSVGVSLPRSPKWYIPGDEDDYESYMKLWK